MVKKVSTLTENLDPNLGVIADETGELSDMSSDVNASVSVAVTAPAGRAMSFEEARAWAFEKYDGALRELAK